MECGTLTFRLTGQALKFCDKIHDFEKIFLTFKCFNLASKARHFFLQTLVTIGLPKEMRMLGKMSVDIGVDVALLPALCKELLQSVEVDLFCDDSKQAQVKLREVESLLQEDLRSQPRKTKTKSSKTSEFLMPNERQELICASPNMTKGLHGLPEWLIKNSQANSLLLTIVLKYFTFQAVVWHLEGDNEAMSNYFHKVEDVINKETKDKRPLSSMLTCQKWMFECYARLDEFDLCNGVLTSMKSVLSIKPIPYWTSVFKEAAISLALAKNDRNLNFEPSPIRPGSAMYPEAQVALTPSIVKQRPSRLPQLKSKKAVPVLFETEVKMLKLNINEEDEEEFKTPICKSTQKATRPTRSRSSSKTTRK